MINVAVISYGAIPISKYPQESETELKLFQEHWKMQI